MKFKNKYLILFFILLCKYCESKPTFSVQNILSEQLIHENTNTNSERMDTENVSDNRKRRGLFGGYEYKGPLGPISFDYDLGTPPPTINLGVEKAYAQLEHDTVSQPEGNQDIYLTTTKPEVESETEKEIDSYLPPNYDPPASAIENDESGKNAGNKEISVSKKPIDINKLHYLPPSTSYGVPIIETNSHDTDLKPNKELLSIAEKHIKETNLNVATTKTNNKEQEEKSETNVADTDEKKHSVISSYGVPLSSVTGYPPYEIAKDNDNITVNKLKTGGPPSTSYGVPNNEIYTLLPNVSKNSNDVSTKHMEDAKPYDLISSSYGAPLKSVTSLTNETSSATLGIPEARINIKFNPNEDVKDSHQEIKSNDTEKAASLQKKYVVIPAENFEMINVCMEKSLSTAYILKNNGNLVKE